MVAQRIVDAEARLGVVLPLRMAELYESSDGHFREDGQWWVVWPIERVVDENQRTWRDELLPRSMVAFGDDGTGNPFLVRLDDATDEVLRWSWIDLDVETSAGTMAMFVREWLS